MYTKDLFNPNQKKKLKGNKLVDNSKNLNSVEYSYSIIPPMENMVAKTHTVNLY